MNRRQFLLSTAAGALALNGCATATRRDTAASARALYDAIFEDMLRVAPELATRLGLDTGERAPLKSRLADAADKTGQFKPLLEFLPQLQRLDRASLDGRERVWADTIVWLGEVMSDIATVPFGGMRGYGYPVPYVISQLTGSYQSIPDFLDSVHRIDSREDAQAYLSRLEAFARNVDLEIGRVRADAASGVVPPTFIIDKALTQTRAANSRRGEQSGLVKSLVRRTGEKGIEGDWARQASAIVDGPLNAALERQAAMLIELRRGADENPAATRLPGGERFYQLCLRFHTTTKLTPEEAHKIGLEQVADISAQADTLLRGEGLTKGTVGARLTELGQQDRYLYPNTDAGRAQILVDLNGQMLAAREHMPRHFATLARSPMEVKRVPSAIELGAPRGYAQWPSLDGSRPGAYYINLVNTRIWPKWALPTLTYHESVPGHLWQGSTMLEDASIPLLHRNIGIPAYVEGWGLYAEQLADEIGMYADFKVGRIGMLQSFLYRAARIVLDTGLHAKGWSREKAIKYFVDVVGLDPIAATSEVERYVVWPGQACSYKIGHTEIVRLRELARARMGARFDIKGFHDAVLRNGNVPLEVLGTVVAQWQG